MEKETTFYYDETNHSRKISSNTMKASSFRLDFISTIVGVLNSKLESFENAYKIFEEKWKKFYCCEELKSTVIKDKKYKYGLSSFLKEDINFYQEFFSLVLNFNAYLHFGIFNKIEYLVLQMLNNGDALIQLNLKSLSYSASKSLCAYRPKRLLSLIEEDFDNFLPTFKSFLEKRIKLNTRIHGESEDEAFYTLLNVLNFLNKDINLKWDYSFSFDGFKKYISELKLVNSLLIIDKEGNGTTLQTAEKEGIKNVTEGDSKAFCGIRCADLISGFLSNFINSIQNETSYEEDSKTRDESLLSIGWFNNLNEAKFNLYKKAYSIFYSLNNSWYKYYASSYSDGLCHFLALLKHFNEYDTFDDFKKDSIDEHQHRVNTILYYDLMHHFKELSPAMSFETANKNDSGHLFNQKGAEIFEDINKYNMLKLPSKGEEIKYLVLSMGFQFVNGSNNIKKPVITISENGESITYLLPDALTKQVYFFIGLSTMGQNVFPSFIKLTFDGKNYSFALCNN